MGLSEKVLLPQYAPLNIVYYSVVYLSFYIPGYRESELVAKVKTLRKAIVDSNTVEKSCYKSLR